VVHGTPGEAKSPGDGLGGLARRNLLEALQLSGAEVRVGRRAVRQGRFKVPAVRGGHQVSTPPGEAPSRPDSDQKCR
jgi:hypothetical protein